MRLVAAITACTLALTPALVHAQDPAPATTTAAPAQPGWDDEPAASPPPPRVDPSTAPPNTDVPPPPPRDSRAGKGLLFGGVALIGVGAASLLFIAAPAAIVKRVALDRAERDTAIGLSTHRQRYHRARIADDTMEGAFWVGISAVVIGTALAITGGVMRSRARSRAMARLGGGPGGLSIRF
jgi:hypothetical protein